MVADLDKARERASEQATDWLILLQDGAGDRDLLRQFDAWLAENPLHIEAWVATDYVAGVIGRTPSAYTDRWRPLLEAHRAGGGSAYSPPTMPRAPPRAAIVWSGRRLPGRAGLGFAASALAACLAIVVMPSAVLHFRADYATGIAETRTVTLDDGSSVVLAPDSAIRVAYTGAERRIELLAGDAFFTVVHNDAKPFRVAVEGVETTDLGTAFEVRRGDDGAAIAVQHGSVQIDYRSAPTPVSETLRAGHSVRVAWNGAAISGEEPESQIAAWRQNQLIARDRPMREVVDQLRPYFAGTIIVTNVAAAAKPVTGVYNLADPVDALRGIAQAHGANVHRLTPWILVVSGG